jgi:hypothetical protein
MHTWVRAVCVCMCCHDNVRRGGGGAEGATCAVRPRQRRGRTLATRATHTRRDTNCPHALDRARNSVRNAVVTRCTVCVYVCQQVCQCCCPCRVGRVVSSSSWSVPPSPRQSSIRAWTGHTLDAVMLVVQQILHPLTRHTCCACVAHIAVSQRQTGDASTCLCAQ